MPSSVLVSFCLSLLTEILATHIWLSYIMSQSTKSGSGKVRRAMKKDNANLFKDGFNWDKYLQICNLPAAPSECFTQSQNEILENKFQENDKIEAQDPRNPTSICLATVVALQGPRILIRLDGGDACNDFWKLVDSADIFPLGTHEAKGTLLQPPLGYTKNMSTWTSFLAKNREKGEKADKDCFLSEPSPPEINLFEIGMKLEAVDRKNPDLICPATIGDVKADQVFVSFDGWRGAMDYWCHYDSRDLFPVGWCHENDHPLSSPGNKGDNPAVVERLKLLADKSKRQTRSGTGSAAESEKGSGKIRQTDSPPLVKYESSTHSKGVRGRSRGRVIRSLTPVSKTSEKSSEEFAQARLTPSHVSSVTESSAESETCDSSLSSSHQSSESSSSEEEPEESLKEEEEEKIEESGNSDFEEPIVEVKKSVKRDLSSSTERKKKHLERKFKKKKKDKKRLKRMHHLGENGADSYNERKRFASAGDEEIFAVRMKKRKKNKRKHSMSSMYESSQKRIVGFGNQTSVFHNAPKQNPDIQSPSFLDHATSPTSLFGFSRDEIVKKATEGWPSRFMGSSKRVVTSDNKLGRFGPSNNVDSSCQTSELDTKPIFQDDENAQVTTTTQIDGSKSSESHKRPDSTTSLEGGSKISSQTVSSTTNPTQMKPQISDDNKVQILNKPSNEESSLPRKRSRNPQRWSVTDVMGYIQECEPALTSQIHLFQTHEIDGQALLLLNSTIAVKYMNMKLGPALKLSNLVEQLKELVPPPRSPR